MKIRELVEQTLPQATNTTPGNVVGPVPAGGKPSGDSPIPNTEPKPNTSNTPKTTQPTGFAPSTKAPSAPTTVPTQPQQQVGQSTSQTIQPQSAQPEDEEVENQEPGQQPATVQDLQTQMGNLMAKLRQIQGQEPPPETLNPQPGVSG